MTQIAKNKNIEFLESFGLKKHLNLIIKMDKSEFIKFLDLYY